MLDATLKAMLARQKFADQSELLEALSLSGFKMTQSTLSRKLKQLGYQKFDGRYTLSSLPKIALLSVVAVPPNLLVLRTSPGFANALAVRLDVESLPGQAGTIAGDDTVFVAVQPTSLVEAEREASSWVS